MQPQSPARLMQDSVIGGNLHTGNVVHNHYHLVNESPPERIPVQPEGCGSSNQLEERELSEAYLLWFFLGLFGGHRFYIGDITLGVIYLFTLGIFGIGWITDAFLLPNLIQSANKKITIER